MQVKLYDYFWARAFFKTTGIVFGMQLFFEMSGIVNRKPQFDWVIYACAFAFGLSLIWSAALILVNAWRTHKNPDVKRQL
jgi:hypothetical protein